MEHVRDLLSAYMDETLDALSRSKVEAHLRECGSCRENLEGIRKVSAAVSSLPKAALPAGFLERLKSKRVPSATNAKTWLPSQGRLVALAAASVVAGFVFFRYRLETVEKYSNYPADAEEAQETSDKLGTLPLEERKSSDARYTNEALHVFLENEKNRMGIKEILPKRSADSASSDSAEERSLSHEETMAAVRRMASEIALVNRQRQARFPPPVSVKTGSRPLLLANQEDSRPVNMEAAAPAAPANSLVGVRGQASVGDENISPAAATQRQLSWSGFSDNALSGGVVIKNRSDWDDLWHHLNQKGSAPEVDFNREMLVGIFLAPKEGTPRILSSALEGERFVVRYRRGQTKRLQQQKEGSYHILIIPSSEQPIYFEQTP